MGIFDSFSKLNVKRLKAKRDVEGLVKALCHDNLGVRVSAARALGEIGDKRAVEPLIETLKNEYFSEYAAEALGKIGDARAVEPLIMALRFVNWEYEEACDFSLSWGEPVTLGYKYQACKSEIVEALVKIGLPAVDPLIKAFDFDHEYYNISKEVAEALVEIGLPTVDPLIKHT